ncbi:hypothetical protein GCM10011494_31830 [Novosphingobium endophyticum]|uniref:Uncharacterized protein n=1 Tax=Novosphingobium endophyticum TaxID=1955250 RepID=A0A916TUJ8_9SPHN|nr:hypothetical protein [Novosphingobium endophyticum]GGC10729.1 hypothetical protein GCM10011494_31830 [Novosphingobium endophyticum]
MRGRYTILTQTVMAMALAGLPASAGAQSIGTWSLPEPEDTATPRAQGPVDTQNPVVLRPDAESSPSPAPTASASPALQPTITPLPVITPPPVPRAAAEAPASGPVAAPGAGAGAARQESPRPGSSPAETPSPIPIPSEVQAPTIAIGEPAATQAPEGGWPAWWWAVAGAILALGAAVLGLILLRGRASQAGEWVEVKEALPQPERQAAVPEPEVAPPPVTPPAPLPTPNFTPPPAFARDTVTVALEPVTMRLSLFYATLQYRITLTASEAHAPLTLLGDLISAHVSLSQDEQLAPSPANLPRLHSLPGLAPGETVQLKGEIQLALPEIRALRRGGGAYLVPLVRICLIGEDGTALRRVFTVGLPGSGAGLAPLRTDTGPRSFEPLAAREIEVARQLPLQTESLPLDPQRAAG